MMNNICLKLLICLLFLMILSTLLCQDLPLLYRFALSHQSVDSASDLYFRDMEINSSNIILFTYKLNFSGFYLRIFIRLGMINAVNNISWDELAEYDNSDFADVYSNFVKNANSVAFASLTGNVFKWQYDQNTSSQTLILPGSSYSILGTSQLDDNHCLIMFHNHTTNMAEVYYLYMNAYPVWNCTVDIASHSTAGMQYHSFHMKDDNHFCLGFNLATGSNNYKLLTFNNQGAVTDSIAFNLGSNTYVAKTGVSGRLLITSYSEPYLSVCSLENNLISPIINLPIAEPQSEIPVVADSNGIVFSLYTPSQFIKIIKYDWDGNFLWERTIANSASNITGYNPENIRLSPTSCIVTSYYTTKWEYIYTDYNNLAHYGWVPYVNIVKVLPNGVMVDNDDETLPYPETASSAYPNPFRDNVKVLIYEQLPTNTFCKVFDVKGRLIRCLEPEKVTSEQTSYVWDGKNESGSETAPGIYILQSQVKGKLLAKKIIKY